MNAITMTQVSAAIAIMSDTIITERGIHLNDMDALNTVMSEAETEIKNELVRKGMAFNEALALTATAATKHSMPTPAATQLVNDAMKNRGKPLPVTASNQADITPENDNSGPDQQIQGENTVSPAVEPSQAQPVEVPASIPASTPAASPAVAMVQPNIIREMAERTSSFQPRAYQMRQVKVSDVFGGIDANDKLFSFDIPIIDWQEPHPSVPEVDPHYNMDPAALLTALYAVASKKSVAIVGPHGSGKTKMIEQIGARLNMPVTIIPMDGQMTRGTLFGQEKIRSTETGPESYYQYGVLPRAMMEPGFIVFDEFDRADPGVQYACHSVYEQTGLRLLEHDGAVIPMHPMNRILGTANTKGRGSDDGMYLGAIEMSEATRDRFSLWIELDYQDVQDDVKVISAKVSGIKKRDAVTVARLADQIRKSYNQGNLSQTCSMRQMLEAAQMYVAISGGSGEPEKCLRYAIEQVIMGRASNIDRGAIETALRTLLPGAYTGETLI